jgi:hypothetical protein
MRDRALALAAYLVLLGFLGLLVWKVQSPDLALVVAATLGLAAVDLFRRGPRPH